MIYLEPRSILDKAIVKCDNVVHYDYDKLVECFMKLFKEHGPNESHIMAIEWIDYNILGCYMEGWPNIIFEETEIGLSEKK